MRCLGNRQLATRRGRRATVVRGSLIPLIAAAGLLLLIVVLTILVAGRLRQQAGVIDQQSQSIEALSRRVAEIESRR